MKPEQQRIAIAPVWERFWSKVDVAEPIKCWNWRGGKDDGGYGNFNFEGLISKAPRIAFLSRFGRLPVNACHRCDNPSCCNPDHIFDGSHADNMHDMTIKGRFKSDRGENHGGAVLTDAKVIAMREDYKTGQFSMNTLAVTYGCSFGTVQRVISRKNWKHLP